MAGGVLGYLVDVYSPQNLHSIIVEPDKADCIYRSGVKGDIVNVGGDMATIMAGTACGEPNPLGWKSYVTAPPNSSPAGQRCRIRYARAG